MHHKTNIGINIKPTMITLVETAKGLFSHTLLNVGVKVLPTGADNAFLEKTLRELLTEHPIFSDEVKISLSGDAAIAQFARFPFAEKDELAELVKRHLEKLVPFPPEECIVDIDILGKEPDEMINVIIACANKKFIDERVSLLHACGLTPHMICIDGLALHKLYATQHKNDETKSYILCHTLGGCNTAIVVANGMPFVIKDFSGFDPREIFNDICKIRDTVQSKEIVKNCDTVILAGDYHTVVELEHLLCTKRDIVAHRWNPIASLKMHKGLAINEQRAYSLALPLAIALAH